MTLQVEVRERDLEFLEPPSRGMSVCLRLKWHNEPIMLRDMQATLHLPRDFSGARLTHPLLIPGYPRVVHAQQEWEERIEFPLSTDAIRVIEKHRRGDVRFRMELKWATGNIRDYNATGAIPFALLSSMSLDRREVIWDVPHSEWVKALTKLEWDQIDVIEIHRGALIQHENLAATFEHLRSSQQAMWRGDHRQVAIECRLAVESMLRHFGADDAKAGAKVTWELIFPGDAERQDLINELVLKLQTYLHLFRHGRAPVVNPTRSEAELFLYTTNALISLVSRRLAKQEA